MTIRKCQHCGMSKKIVFSINNKTYKMPLCCWDSFFEWWFSSDIKISQDGDKICALIGKDLQTGYAGFGSTSLEAALNLIDNIIKIDCQDY